LRAAIALVVLAWVAAMPYGWARGPTRAESPALPAVALEELPAEARHAIRLIRNGGPFPYQRDGVVFGNFERVLPARNRGYYREYTVPTPGISHRGARRIVAGRNGELFYTDDHYRSFKRIRE
jgi:ribonuclease T1